MLFSSYLLQQNITLKRVSRNADSHFIVAHQFGRYQSEADIQQALQIHVPRNCAYGNDSILL
jgi:hypothetical protein